MVISLHIRKNLEKCIRIILIIYERLHHSRNVLILLFVARFLSKLNKEWFKLRFISIKCFTNTFNTSFLIRYDIIITLNDILALWCICVCFSLSFNCIELFSIFLNKLLEIFLMELLLRRFIHDIFNDFTNTISANCVLNISSFSLSNTCWNFIDLNIRIMEDFVEGFYRSFIF